MTSQKILMTSDGELQIPTSFDCIEDFIKNPSSVTPINISKTSYYEENFFKAITNICKGKVIVGLVNEAFEIILAFDEQNSLVFLVNVDQADEAQMKLLESIQAKVPGILKLALASYANFFTNSYVVN